MNSCNQKHTIYTGETVGLVLAMYEVDGNPYIKFYQVRFYHSGISGDNRLHYTIIDPLGTTIYNEYNLSLNLGETGIEVGMYGKSNYEEVISYDDLKSKLGL